MAHESFEDAAVAEKLNRDFISVKVDREERPDIDNVYMRACQAMTGGGGWPASIFIDAKGTPFYAGTYFPKEVFLGVLEAVSLAWRQDRSMLETRGRQLAAAMARTRQRGTEQKTDLIRAATGAFQSAFDPEYGGFGSAPKFPSPHNLLFLLRTAPEMAEKTLKSMYQGGIFDHIGGGFSRYSTDRRWLIPHFEKMLYDNALLAIAYLTAYEATEKPLYRTVAERVLLYLEREMRAPDGGFYASQDADSEDGEGRFYLFTPGELTALLGKEAGVRFCRRYDITEGGNFEGESIPNLLNSLETDNETDALLPRVYAYRRRRPAPHTDVKELTAWNALAAAAFATAARVLKEESWLAAAKQTVDFIEQTLTEGDAVFSGVTGGKRLGPGFLDDYAFYIFALLQLHQASLDQRYLTRAAALTVRVQALFQDDADDGFFFSGAENERLITRTKESWDGAMPSGNSVMAYNLSRLSLLLEDDGLAEQAAKQSRFLSDEAASYPMGYGFYLWSSLPVKKIVCVSKDTAEIYAVRVRSDWVFRVTNSPVYPLINGKTTYYVCEEGICRPPVNEL